MQTRKWIILRARSVALKSGSERMVAESAEGAEIIDEQLSLSAEADILSDPKTLAAAPDMPVSIIEPLSSGGDAHGASNPIDQWGFEATGAAVSPFDGAGVKVAVLDTGINAEHKCFAGVNLQHRDFTGSGSTEDRNGHGTHCAATVFGRDMGVRVGVARGVTEAIIGKVVDNSGHGSTLATVLAMQWAANLGANIVSMSLGINLPKYISGLIDAGTPSGVANAMGLDAFRRSLHLFERQSAFMRALSDDILIVAAAGNDSQRDHNPNWRAPLGLPACGDDILSVGAIGRSPEGFRIASFSNSLPNLCGPGIGITSAWMDGGLKTLSGTSMACPFVAGIAALWWQSLGQRANAALVRSKIEGYASVDGFAPGYDHTDIGAGVARGP